MKEIIYLKLPNNEEIKYVIFKDKKYLNLTSHNITLWNGVTECVVPPSGLSVKSTVEYKKVDEKNNSEIYSVKFKGIDEHKILVEWLHNEHPDIILLGSILSCKAYKHIYALKIVEGYEKVPREEKMAYYNQFIKCD